MNYKHVLLLGSVLVAGLVIGQSTPPTLNIAQQPLYTRASLPPLNMLVMGRDHKIYSEAYNDASDLDGDGTLDVGYRGWEVKGTAPSDGTSRYKIDYYGYFNSYACYKWNGDMFEPVGSTDNKQCSGTWSGDFLNYLTTSRMDALRRVLYGGWRQVDHDGQTVLQGAYFPQDGHSWGKEYQSVARDGYDISNYTPLRPPQAGNYHLFAMTTLKGNDAAYPAYQAPVLRVLQNTSFRVWNWLSIEGPVAGNKCFTEDNTRVDCVGAGENTNPWQLVPAGNLAGVQTRIWRVSNNNAYNGSPGDRGAMDAWFNNAVDGQLCGTRNETRISKEAAGGNPFRGTNGCTDNRFISRITATLSVASDGTYQFAVDGDDAVDVTIDGTPVASWYGGHARDNSNGGLNNHSGSIQLSAGNHQVVFRHQQDGGDSVWGLYWKLPDSSGSSREDYLVRVLSCPDTAELREPTCKAYPNGHYKPTGILHDYGESQRMYFGLITGSQYNNLEGGVLRRNISDFSTEIDPQTGIFKSDVDGIANTISKFRMIGGGYNGGVTDNTNGDTNWGWNNNGGNCPTPDESQPLNNGECRMWGNPLAEMLYESMRYFAGAGRPTQRFRDANNNGVGEETTMRLSTENWKDPYAALPAGGGYPACARPYQTIISDINPSYDGDLPGSAFGDAVTSTNNTPASIAGFDAAAMGQEVWNKEFGGPRTVFIGDVGGDTDGAPTAKVASSFGNIRGLSPEEPTKNGTYYSASVAYFARNNDLNAAQGQQNLSTYSIALASPLPKIEFPVNGKVITLLPFAKTASGTFGQGPRKPTNGIVAFYVEKIVNLPNQPRDESVNQGRPSAVFRISYEDSEQGNDYDMDAIVRYTVEANNDGTLTVTLDSEYAAGSADQNIGYVISGTTRDGVYLVVRDRDSNAGSFRPYDLNTPPGRDPGDCRGVTNGVCNQQLPLNSTRTFTPSQGGSDAIQLNNPLWYAAKYGAPTQGLVNADGSPANYFLVTNPLNLRDQLSNAFDSIQAQGGNSGSLSVAGARVNASSFVVIPSYNSLGNGHDWIGDLTAYRIGANGLPGDVLWRAASQIPAPGSRKIFTALADVNSGNRNDMVRPFEAEELGENPSDRFGKLGYTLDQVANLFGSSTTPERLVGYLRGERDNEGAIKNTAPFRTRSAVMGDIINSTPVIASKRADYGWGAATGLTDTVRNSYAAYVSEKSAEGRSEYVYVGANDGMLHAFDDSGHEAFAYVPNGVLGNMGLLADPNYGSEVNTHRYYVDGAMTLGDAHDGSGWQTLLVGAAGAGGRSVFGLNVSNPDGFGASDVLWEVNSQTDADIGFVLGKPVIVPLQNGHWGAVFGNGYNSAGSKPVLFVVDVFTGTILKKIAVDDGEGAVANGLGNIAAIDTDGDGLMDTVYGGDLHGNVWKFDLSNASEAQWAAAYDGAPLFVAKDAAGQRQPITGSFEVAVGPGTGYMIYFGTGRYFLQGDNNASPGQQVQSLYGVWDNGVAITGNRDAVLVGQSILAEVSGARAISRNPVDYISRRGWYLDLVTSNAQGVPQTTGERFIATPRIQSGQILFDTYQPGITNDCEPGGQNWRYGLNLFTGGPSLGPVNTVDGTPVGDGSTGAVAISPGAPSRDIAVTQPPSIYPPLYCDPADPSCTPTPPGAKCSELIIDPNDPSKSLVKQRACGRQSWRQLR